MSTQIDLNSAIQDNKNDVGCPCILGFWYSRVASPSSLRRKMEA